MATENNLHIPEDLLSAVNEAASADGKSSRRMRYGRYLAHRKLEISRRSLRTRGKAHPVLFSSVGNRSHQKHAVRTSPRP